MSVTALIALAGVSRRFDRTPAIDALTVAFQAGRLNGVVGPDGAG